MNKKIDDNKNKTIIITNIAIKAALYCLKYYKYLNFINNNIYTSMLNAKKRMKGSNEDVKVTIIDFKDSGPVIIFLKKKLDPSHSSKELINYKIIYFIIYYYYLNSYSRLINFYSLLISNFFIVIHFN